MSVFWDRTIPAGGTWRDTIGKELERARCVMVLWSPNSVSSRWVLDEADHAISQKIPVLPVLIADVQLPLGFGGIQAANFSHWDGTETDPEFQRLLKDIKGHTGAAVIFPFVEFKADETKELRVLSFSSRCREFYGCADDVDLSNKSARELIGYETLHGSAAMGCFSEGSRARFREI